MLTQNDVDLMHRYNIVVGLLVEIRIDGSEDETRGYVAEILSKGVNKKGIRVRLTNGKTGKVLRVVTKEELELEQFKFLNIFFSAPKTYVIWDCKDCRYFLSDFPNKMLQKMEKAILLFDDIKKAQKFLENKNFGKKLKIHEVNRKKPIVDSFKHIEFDMFILNAKKRVEPSKMKELENKYKAMC